MNRTFTKYKAGMEEIEVLVHGAANLFKPGSERLSPARALHVPPKVTVIASA
mgnify:CR=1 FL=1